MTSDEVLQDLIYYCPNEKCLDVTIIYSLPKQLIEPLLAWSKFVLGMDTPLLTFSGDMRTGDEMQNAVVQQQKNAAKIIAIIEGIGPT